ncbi:uncharacterized protein LY89DRAFT_765146 [Mollisia scopiformis]|uniref:Uncharacterized protein n=1 Tax=Mollisia scopiformis TaxID=149040 RepID=A0A132B7B6_MOLSC|nr:uncharacterized protein LY89DRAFT_765146 [Mollisia scopiformis]KUJ08302.1 hypothetical protein LY89DRAFT_765146 [Mollisia scopiformis]
MGYFVVDFGLVLHQQSVSLKPLVDQARNQNSNGTKTQHALDFNLQNLQHRYWALNNWQLEAAWRGDLIDMPTVSSQKLAKLDRGDKIAKVFALIQILYLLVQIIGRKVASLPSTQLEIATLAFAVSSSITYVLHWKRPQGVDSVYILKAKKVPTLELVTEIASCGATYVWAKNRTPKNIGTGFELDLAPFPNDGGNYTALEGDFSRKVWDRPGGNYEILSQGLGAMVGGILFGGCHCIAWNFQHRSNNLGGRSPPS